MLTKLSKKYPLVKWIQIGSNGGPHHFPGGDNYEIPKIHWWNLKIFCSRTIVLISIKPYTMHSWVREIQICLNEGKVLFSRGDNYKIVKIYWQNLKTLFKLKSSTTGSISTNLCAKHIWVKGIPVGSNEETFHSQNVDNGFSSLNQRYDKIMCLLIWTVFSGERCGPWASCYDYNYYINNEFYYLHYYYYH